MERDETAYALALSRTGGVGAKTFKKVVDATGSAKRAFEAETGELVEKYDVPEKTARAIKKFSDWDEIEAELEYCRENNIQIITRSSEGYPRLLNLLDDAPPILYMTGELQPRDDLAIAIVGTRNMTPYGKRVAHRLAEDLADGGFTIVSGLARGIDSRAHVGALDAGGRTIAVLGCGLDIIYPSENKRLASKITGNGALISEFPPKTPPAAENFPRRNRVISGLAVATVVVEAAFKSGALITARYALEQGRELFAVPGNIDSKASAGVNKLIQTGAYLADSARTIAQIAARAAENLLGLKVSTRQNTETEAPIGESPNESRQRRASEAELSGLAESERKALEVIGFDEPLNIDEIIERLALPSGEVLGILIGLELKGLVEALPGMQYVRRR